MEEGEGNSSGAGTGLNRNGSGGNWGGTNAGSSKGECYKCGQVSLNCRHVVVLALNFTTSGSTAVVQMN